MVSLMYYYGFFQSLKSRGYVSEQFAWRHFYWYLTNDGISYLRNYLHLPAEVSQGVALLHIKDIEVLPFMIE
jgi:hypothetical protein